MSSAQLKAAAATAGPTLTGLTILALLGTGQLLRNQADPGAALFDGLALTLGRDTNGLDDALVHAVAEANPLAVQACMNVRLAEDDALNAALLRELDLAAYRASRHKP